MSPLSPDEAEIVRAFRAALQQVREEELRRMRHTLSVLELLRDGVAAINADMRAGSCAWRYARRPSRGNLLPQVPRGATCAGWSTGRDLRPARNWRS
jgi:hypothetical protein